MQRPAVYVYKRTSDRGQELRYSLRSLSNLTDWNGEVFVVGDQEDWFSDKVTVIAAEKSADSYQDTRNKLKAACNCKQIGDEFIYLNDDFYVLLKAEVTPLYDGNLEPGSPSNPWQVTKANTKAYLESEGIESPKDYDIHVPMVFDKAKLKPLLAICDEKNMQIRSVYGNINQIGGKRYKDGKRPDNGIQKRKFVSTRLFNNELERIFPNKSEFEK